MSEVCRLQDLPPTGGYPKIPFARVPPKSYFSGYTMIAGYLGITAGAFYLFYLNTKHIHLKDIENRSSALAIYPLILAERDRAFLKQCRRNREEEAKLMAKVPGWKVGTWYGEKVYHTLPCNTFVSPQIYEYYVHSKYSDTKKRFNFAFWS